MKTIKRVIGYFILIAVYIGILVVCYFCGVLNIAIINTAILVCFAIVITLLIELAKKLIK